MGTVKIIQPILIEGIKSLNKHLYMIGNVSFPLTNITSLSKYRRKFITGKINFHAISIHNLEIVRSYSTVKEASDELGMSTTSIYHALSGRILVAGNLFWITDEEYQKYGINKFKTLKFTHTKCESDIDGKIYFTKRIKPYILIAYTHDEDLNKYEIIHMFRSFKEAHEQFNFDPSSIYKCIQGKFKLYRGLKWEKPELGSELADFIINKMIENKRG